MKTGTYIKPPGARGESPDPKSGAYRPKGDSDARRACRPKGDSPRPHKKLFILTSLFSFSTSIIIELIQLVFCLGTFQVSDLVYNTLGGVMGAIIFATVRKLYRHIKKARTQ